MQDKENDNAKQIALVSKDISYIKKDLGEIKIRLDQVLEHYVQRDEMEARFGRMQTEIDKRFEGAHDRIDKKLNKEEFEPFRKLFWTIAGSLAIMAVSGGIISAILLK